MVSSFLRADRWAADCCFYRKLRWIGILSSILNDIREFFELFSVFSHAHDLVDREDIVDRSLGATRGCSTADVGSSGPSMRNLRVALTKLASLNEDQRCGSARDAATSPNQPHWRKTIRREVAAKETRRKAVIASLLSLADVSPRQAAEAGLRPASACARRRDAQLLAPSSRNRCG